VADTVGIRPAVSGDLDLLWDVLAIAAPTRMLPPP
jgi:hypothetical protein